MIGKKNYILVIFFVLFIIISCSKNRAQSAFNKESRYKVIENKVYYDNIVLEDVDLKSFIILNKYYARDKENIYWKEEKIDGIDTDSFEILDINYSRDRNNVYGFKGIKIEGADISSFTPIKNKLNLIQTKFLLS